jgi:hypothetical protein
LDGVGVGVGNTRSTVGWEEEEAEAEEVVFFAVINGH